MVRLLSLSLVASVLSSAFAAPQAAQGPPALVNLRIEGAQHAIFEGPVLTRGHDMVTASGGAHHCDGTNFGVNPTPGPTCTSALDDASKAHGFGWDGTYWAEFDDYFITTIGGETNTTEVFWGILLNYQFTPVGGCQQRVGSGDEVLFAFDAFTKNSFLKLEGPHTAQKGKNVTLKVTDGTTGNAIEGAEVPGGVSASDAEGNVVVVFGKLGVQGVKAEKADAIRSNRLDVLVLP